MQYEALWSEDLALTIPALKCEKGLEGVSHCSCHHISLSCMVLADDASTFKHDPKPRDSFLIYAREFCECNSVFGPD